MRDNDTPVCAQENALYIRFSATSSFGLNCLAFRPSGLSSRKTFVFPRTSQPNRCFRNVRTRVNYSREPRIFPAQCSTFDSPETAFIRTLERGIEFQQRSLQEESPRNHRPQNRLQKSQCHNWRDDNNNNNR